MMMDIKISSHEIWTILLFGAINHNPFQNFENHAVQARLFKNIFPYEIQYAWLHLITWISLTHSEIWTRIGN